MASYPLTTAATICLFTSLPSVPRVSVALLMVKRSSTLSSLLKVAPRLLRSVAPTATLFVDHLDPDAAAVVVVMAVDPVVMVEGEGEAVMVEEAVVEAPDVISVVRWAI
ncbi:hypothetical protein J1N35_005795 [Gossypium stocksii]|uniref:Uncharacterized protein n=1 Tax=Gossypium stocksii TaxID=47602 RepID=A0A9D3WG04_9ROSI|nr:hypothetical protein J1N35_005795 [Gossypium stocksii]